MMCLVVCGCSTIDTYIPKDALPAVYFYKAQTAIDNFDNEAALLIFKKFLDTHPSDKASRLSVQYEIALLHFKKGDNALAKQGFSQILKEYRESDQTILPGWIRVLAEKKLTQIPD